MYPTPYDKVRLGALDDLKLNFPNVTIGLSDHSIGNYTCFAAIPYGALILEKHFTSNKKWKGPDIPVSIDPKELKQLIEGSAAIKQALDGKKTILNEEKPTIKFAYASVVTTENIKKDDFFTEKNIWVKRPGTGEIPALQYENILKKRARKNIPKNNELYDYFKKSNKINKPKAIIANTIKGKGFSFSENNNDWHHSVLTNSFYEKALKELLKE